MRLIRLVNDYFYGNIFDYIFFVMIYKGVIETPEHQFFRSKDIGFALKFIKFVIFESQLTTQLLTAY